MGCGGWTQNARSTANCQPGWLLVGLKTEGCLLAGAAAKKHEIFSAEPARDNVFARKLLPAVLTLE